MSTFRLGRTRAGVFRTAKGNVSSTESQTAGVRTEKDRKFWKDTERRCSSEADIPLQKLLGSFSCGSQAD